jgi:basic membrane lipoprotein Med (substrate-binding protein (PBP1-ABC) superfamily)
MATLIGDVVGQPSSLPLFQYTLTELFDRRDGQALTLDEYRRLGGVSGVIGATAERLYDQLTATQRDTLRIVLLRLVTIDENRQRARRRVEAAELLTLQLDVADLDKVLDSFGRHRLLSFDRSAAGAPTVELAHEALLAEWPTLRAWVDDAQDEIRRRVMLDFAITEWSHAGRDPEFLPTGGRLAEFERWASSSTVSLDEPERDFLRCAVARRDDDDHDAARRESVVVSLQRRARRRSWALLAVVVAVFVAVGGVLAVRQFRVRPLDIAVVEPPHDSPVAGIEAQLLNGVADLARDGGVRVDAVTPVSDITAEVDRLLASDPDIAILPGVSSAQLGLDVAAMARTHPDVRVVQIEGVQPDAPPPNLTTLTFPANDGSFLAGAAAALTSTAGRIGFIGGFPGAVESFRAGYEAGARAVDPSIDVVSTYPIGEFPRTTFNEPDTVHAAALDLYRRGADVVFNAAGGAGRGIAQAATEESERTGRQLWAIGVDVDEWLTDGTAVRDHILTSLLKRHDLAITNAVDRFRHGDLPAGLYEFALADGSLELSRSGGHLDEAVIERVEQLRQAIADGTITVPDTPLTGPSIVADADVTVDLTYDGVNCTSTTPRSTTAANNDVLRVDVTNTSSGPITAKVVLLDDWTSTDLTGSEPFTFAVVAPHGTQTMTGRAFPNHFGIGCATGTTFTVATEIHVPDDNPYAAPTGG